MSPEADVIFSTNVPDRAIETSVRTIESCPYTTTAVAAFALAMAAFADAEDSASAQKAYEGMWSLLKEIAEIEATEV